MNTLAIEKVGDKTRQSVKWSFTLQIIQKLVFFASSIVLARILAPKDFGIATIAITFDVIIWLATTMGINAAIVHFQDHVEERLNAAFWLFLAFSSVFSSMQMMFAPLAAALYKEPVLADILRVTAISIFIICLGSVHKTILIKNIDFKRITILDCFMNMTKSILYIVLALAGFGVWSFIYPKLVTATISTITYWKMSGWRPKLQFHFKYWLEMFRYGKNVLFSNILDYFINNSSYILIGSMIGSASLGIYTFAYDKSMLVVNNITYPISMISFPAFAKLQDHHDRLKNAFFKTIKLVSLITFPIAIGQIILGPEYITLVFGSKWKASIAIFQMILVYSMLRTISQSGTSILNGVGKPHVTLRCNMVYTPIFLGSLYLASKIGGIFWIGFTTALVGSLWAIIYSFIVVRVLGWSFKEVLAILFTPLTSSIIMAVFLYWTRQLFKQADISSPVMLAILIPLGAIVYALSIRLFFKETYDFILDNLWKFLGKGARNVFQKETTEKA